MTISVTFRPPDAVQQVVAIPTRCAVLFFAPVILMSAQTASKGWVLTFSDEFEGKELEFPKWSTHDPWGHAQNRESQAWVPGAVQLQAGILRLTARRESASYDGQAREYTSGIVTTLGSFAQTYGRFEIRCRIPAGQGLEPRFSLLPVPSGDIPGIDILDAIGSDPGTALFANRWGDLKTERSYSGSWKAPDFSKDFHVFAIEWDQDKIVWLVDGKERFRSRDGIPHQPMYLLASLAVGGNQAKWPDATTPFPSFFDIDYIRVYRLP
ncbi:MAG: glycoside hydrolase family 16 protein [Acidobacteriota bacterium]